MTGVPYWMATGNSMLAGRSIFVDGHAGERISFVFDKTIPDHRWQLYAGREPIGRQHDIGEHVASDVRRAIQHHQAKSAGVVTTSEADKNPLAPSTLNETPIQEGQPAEAAFSPKGDQFVWQF